MSAILLSGEFLAAIVPSQTVHAEFNCVAGYGAPGGTSHGGQSGATGGVGGDCVLGGGYKAFAPGGFNQNNGNQGVNQENGGRCQCTIARCRPQMYPHLLSRKAN